MFQRTPSREWWDNIFASHVSYKGLGPRIYKELLHLKHKKTTQLKNGQGPEWTSVYRYVDVHM